MSEGSESMQGSQAKMKRKVSSSDSGKRARVASGSPARTSGSTNNASKQACVACRQRKIRCDAQQPCAYCASKNKDCVYGPAFKRAQCAQAHVDALEAKVRDLERASRVQYNRPDIPNPSPLAIAGTPGQEGGSNDGQSGFHARNGVADGSPASSSHKPQRRYGKSTSLHFALNVKASATAMPEDVGGVEGGTSPNGDAEDAGDGEEEEEEEEWLVEYTSPSPGMSQLLPHRHTAKALFDKYFEVVHPIWPFLLESESRDLFAQTWTSDDPPEPLWMVQLNLIMCLGCQQYESETDGTDTISRSDATSSGKDFYQRAQGYVYANAFTTSNAGMLQALLLMALYQQGAMRFREFYLTVGHAARIAQSLGLHISRPESGPVEPQQREVRRRLWWGCFCTDRISSMLFGRPLGIPYGQFSDYQDLLPRQIDDAYIVLGQPQPPNTPSINSFFRHSVRLYHVMDHVLLKLRDAKKTAYFDLQKASTDMQIQTPISNVNSLMSLFTTILQLDGHLLSWHELLPPHLRFSLDSAVDAPAATVPWIQRQRHHLRSRFLGMRMLLHRQTILFLLQPSERRNWPQNGIQEWPPLFSDCYSDTLVGGSTPIRRQGVPSPVETRLTHLSANICVTSAILQVEATEQHLDSTMMIGEWSDSNSIFNALCILSGAMALHRQDIDVVVPDTTATRNVIRRGFALMRRISTNTGLAGAKLRQSERLLDKLARATVGRQSEKDQSTTTTTGDPSTYVPDPQHPTPYPQQNTTNSLITANQTMAYPVQSFLQPPSSQQHTRPTSSPTNNNPGQPQPLSQQPPHHPLHPQGLDPRRFSPLEQSVYGNGMEGTASASNFDGPFSFDRGMMTGGQSQESYNPTPTMIPPNNIPTGTPLAADGFFLAEGEDSIPALFHHSFDIWGSLDNLDYQGVG